MTTNSAAPRSGLSTSDKNALRSALREVRRSLTPQQQEEAATSVLAQLETIEAFGDSQRIALYLPNDGEIDPSAVIQWCVARGSQAYLPVVQQTGGVNSLKFAPVDLDSRFAENRFGIAEPVVGEQQLVEAQQLDLVLLPLVGFDGRGNRIGMGGGFYDRTFAFLTERDSSGMLPPRPVLIGVAHDVQQVECIAAESWDVPLSTVVTASRVYQLAGGQLSGAEPV